MKRFQTVFFKCPHARYHLWPRNRFNRRFLSPAAEYERDRVTGVRRILFAPGALVSAPVIVDGKRFYWPAIVEFSPDLDPQYVKFVPDESSGERVVSPAERETFDP